MMDEFRRVIYLIAEAMAKHNKVIVANQKEIIEESPPCAY